MLFFKTVVQFYRSYSVSTNSNIKGCLAGLNVIDFSRILAGPFCSMLLSDLGANVFKIEKPGTGDNTRFWGPPFIHNESVYYLTINRNKKSVCIDLKQPQGLKIIKEMVKKADVLLENYIPGKLDELGLGYEDLKLINPGLVYCSISGFGGTGPYAKKPGLDVIAASIGGLLSITGPEDGDPCKVGVAITDLTTGLYAKGAILAALYQRTKTNQGMKIDCNLLSTQVSILANLGTNYLNTGVVPSKRGTAHETVVPYQSFQCYDKKWITLGVSSDSMFRKLCQIIFDQSEAQAIIKDERFLTNEKRVENRKELIRLISKQIEQKTISEWLKLLDGSKVVFGPVNNLNEVFDDPQVIHNQSVIHVNHPTISDLKLLGPAVKYKTDSNCSALREEMTAPPFLGQHTKEVLQNYLNYDQDTIDILEEKKIIQCFKPS